MPLIWSEYNASYKNEARSHGLRSTWVPGWRHDSQCDGLTEMMSYWTFSDVFEEQGVVKRPSTAASG